MVVIQTFGIIFLVGGVMSYCIRSVTFPSVLQDVWWQYLIVGIIGAILIIVAIMFKKKYQIPTSLK